jgi:hypothetical protein
MQKHGSGKKEEKSEQRNQRCIGAPCGVMQGSCHGHRVGVPDERIQKSEVRMDAATMKRKSELVCPRAVSRGVLEKWIRAVSDLSSQGLAPAG